MAGITINEQNPFSGHARTLTFHAETVDAAAIRAVDYIEAQPLAIRHTFVMADGGWGSYAPDVDLAAATVTQAMTWRDQERNNATA